MTIYDSELYRLTHRPHRGRNWNGWLLVAVLVLIAMWLEGRFQ